MHLSLRGTRYIIRFCYHTFIHLSIVSELPHSDPNAVVLLDQDEHDQWLGYNRPRVGEHSSRQGGRMARGVERYDSLRHSHSQNTKSVHRYTKLELDNSNASLGRIVSSVQDAPCLVAVLEGIAHGTPLHDDHQDHADHLYCVLRLGSDLFYRSLHVVSGLFYDTRHSAELPSWRSRDRRHRWPVQRRTLLVDVAAVEEH